jgi:hypothetical protein
LWQDFADSSKRIVRHVALHYIHFMETRAIDIFCEICEAIRRGKAMKPRSADDKEYFAQDWFIDRLQSLAVPFQQQGRNSYPDFWVGRDQDIEGFEIKSLAFTKGKPARKDIDFNSTIPSGQKEGRNVYLVFFLYTGAGKQDRTVHSVSVAHGDLINADHQLADEHLNVAVHLFGSFADGFIRNRKMYVFPHPITIDPDGLGRQRLIVPSDWRLKDDRLRKVKVLDRRIADQTIDRYTIRLRGKGEAEVQSVPAADAGKVLGFDVFELAYGSSQKKCNMLGLTRS